jgi:hypothetical protein
MARCKMGGGQAREVILVGQKDRGQRAALHSEFSMHSLRLSGVVCERGLSQFRRTTAVVAFFKERGLERSEQKTTLTHIERGFNPIYAEYFKKRRCFAWRTLPRETTGQMVLAGL